MQNQPTRKRSSRKSAPGKTSGKNREGYTWIHRDLRPLAEPLDNLTPDPNNARQHADVSLAAITASLREFGQRKPIVANRENGQIEAGNGIYRAAQILGWTHLAVVWVEDDPAAQRGFSLADNRTAELSEWDMARLEALLDDVWTVTPDLYDDLLLSQLRIDPSKPESRQVIEDQPPAVPEVALTQPGDVWLMGPHRVLCGDCCDEDNRRKLMAGVQATMVFTDPPYNVDYAGKTAESLTIANDRTESATFRLFLFRAFHSMCLATAAGGAIYVCHAETEGINFRRSFQQAGWKMAQVLIWVKNTLVMGHSDYQWRHEPILYGWKPGAAHTFYGGRCQSTVIDDATGVSIEELEKGAVITFAVDDRAVVIRVTDYDVLDSGSEAAESIWRFPKPARNAEHPTIKPVGIPARAIRNSSSEDGLVIDFFLGSGSTLSACEQLGRRCFGMELDPRYVDVACRRYLALTGDSPVRESDGKEF